MKIAAMETSLECKKKKGSCLGFTRQLPFLLA
nr:MAG TPA: hypothetical protein [Caudoviricetes sp.]